MPGDVFEEDPFRLDFADDAGDIGPEVALVIGSAPLSGLREWLAGVSGEDGIEGAAEGSSVEGGEVIPYGRRGEVSCALGGDDGLPGILFPLDEAAGVEPRLGKHEAHIKATGSGAEAEPISGR